MHGFHSDDNHGSVGTSTILIDAGRSFGSPSWVVQKLFMHAQVNHASIL